MLKKRLVFALLWDSGHFCLSRNFRLQRVGDLPWLTNQYHFSTVAPSIDELIVLDVTRGRRLSQQFLETVSTLASTMQLPISAGGGVHGPSDVRELLHSGADKVVVNSAFSNDISGLAEIRNRFGQQCIVASIDVSDSSTGYVVKCDDGKLPMGPLTEFVDERVRNYAGEILLNSIDRDGTGQGLDLGIPRSLDKSLEQALILMGGAGKAQHIVEGLEQSNVDAVATSNLLNFLGDGLVVAREACTHAEILLPNRLPASTVQRFHDESLG